MKIKCISPSEHYKKIKSHSYYCDAKNGMHLNHTAFMHI